MKRILFSALALTLLSGSAFASAGFSCEAEEKDPTKFEVAGATPRSGGTLINFGNAFEIEGKKIEFKQSDVKGFTWNEKGIWVRITARSGEHIFNVQVNVKRNPKDEEDWAGTYEVAYGPAAKPKANLKRGPVKCYVE